MAAALGLSAARDQRAVHAGFLGSGPQSVAELVRNRDQGHLRAVLLQPGRRLRADGPLRRDLRPRAAAYLSTSRQVRTAQLNRDEHDIRGPAKAGHYVRTTQFVAVVPSWFKGVRSVRLQADRGTRVARRSACGLAGPNILRASTILGCADIF